MDPDAEPMEVPANPQPREEEKRDTAVTGGLLGGHEGGDSPAENPFRQPFAFRTPPLNPSRRRDTMFVPPQEINIPPVVDQEFQAMLQGLGQTLPQFIEAQEEKSKQLEKNLVEAQEEVRDLNIHNEALEDQTTALQTEIFNLKTKLSRQSLTQQKAPQAGTSTTIHGDELTVTSPQLARTKAPTLTSHKEARIRAIRLSNKLSAELEGHSQSLLMQIWSLLLPLRKLVNNSRPSQ